MYNAIDLPGNINLIRIKLWRIYSAIMTTIFSDSLTFLEYSDNVFDIIRVRAFVFIFQTFYECWLLFMSSSLRVRSI